MSNIDGFRHIVSRRCAREAPRVRCDAAADCFSGELDVVTIGLRIYINTDLSKRV